MSARVTSSKWQRGTMPPFEGLGNDLEVVVHGLLAGFAELQEDVVVGHAGEQAHFIEFHIMGDLEVVHVGADPAGDAGKR